MQFIGNSSSKYSTFRTKMRNIVLITEKFVTIAIYFKLFIEKTILMNYNVVMQDLLHSVIVLKQ